MNKKKKLEISSVISKEIAKEKLAKEKKRFKGAWKDAIKIVTTKGNMWALAVGVLIGSTFGAVVNSLANDIIMAAIAKAVGVNGVASLTANGIAYGKLLSALLTFVIVAFFLVSTTALALYIWRRLVKRKEAEQKINPPALTTNELILEELKKLNENFKSKDKK